MLNDAKDSKKVHHAEEEANKWKKKENAEKAKEGKLEKEIAALKKQKKDPATIAKEIKLLKEKKEEEKMMRKEEGKEKKYESMEKKLLKEDKMEKVRIGCCFSFCAYYSSFSRMR